MTSSATVPTGAGPGVVEVTETDGDVAAIDNEQVPNSASATGFAFRQMVAQPGSVLDPSSSTTTALDADEEVYGDWIDTQSISSMLPFAFGLAQLATFEIEWSADGVTARTDLLGTTNVLTSESETSGFFVYIDTLTTMIDRYARVHIVNGGTAQTPGFYAHSLWRYHSGSYPWTLLGLNDSLSDLSTALLTRAVQAGIDPDGDFVNSVIGGSVTLSPSPSALSASATYTSDPFSSAGHVSLGLIIGTDQVSGTDGVVVEWSDTESFDDVRRTATRTFNADDAASGEKFFTAPNQGDWCRVSITNGGTDQGALFIEARLSPAVLEHAQDALTGAITDRSLATMTRATTLAADADTGEWDNVASKSGGLRTSVKNHEVKTPPATSDDAICHTKTASTTAGVGLASGDAMADRTGILLMNLESNRDLHFATSTARINGGFYATILPGKGAHIPINSDVDVCVQASSSSVSYSIIEVAEVSDT